MLQRRQGELAKLKLRSRHLLKLVLPGFAGGIHIEIPFHVLVGRVRKPRLLLIAGVHGDEYESVAALQDLAGEIDPDRLRGTLTIVPVANPQAFYAGTRRNPVDQGDLNRAFPGNPNGTITERVADLLFRNLVLYNDAVLSMHCWSKEATVIPYVECAADRTAAGRASAALANALGLEFVHPYTWHPGLLVASAVRHGIPAVEPEVGGMGMVTPAGQRSYRNIAFRFLHYLKAVDPRAYQIDPPYPDPKSISHSDCRANHAGLFRSRVNAGTKAEEGSLLGTIHGMAGECLDEIRAPRAGVVGILRTFGSVQPGDLLVQLFWQIKKPVMTRRTHHGW